jgi:hypothetical protein
LHAKHTGADADKVGKVVSAAEFAKMVHDLEDTRGRYSAALAVVSMRTNTLRKAEAQLEDTIGKLAIAESDRNLLAKRLSAERAARSRETAALRAEVDGANRELRKRPAFGALRAVTVEKVDDSRGESPPREAPEDSRSLIKRAHRHGLPLTLRE